MDQIKFRGLDGKDIAPKDWLHVWANRYTSDDEEQYRFLVGKHESLSHDDFVEIGKWKDGVKTANKWKPNIASVAYLIWMQAADELPRCPSDSQAKEFLTNWSERRYEDKNRRGVISKRFGLSRTTALLHFISGGKFPIFDSRVRRALSRLLDTRVENSIKWYLDSYCPLLFELASLCGTEDQRTVDKALFKYGDKNLPFEKP